jgi:hypothetical protein
LPGACTWASYRVFRTPVPMIPPQLSIKLGNREFRQSCFFIFHHSSPNPPTSISFTDSLLNVTHAQNSTPLKSDHLAPHSSRALSHPRMLTPRLPPSLMLFPLPPSSHPTTPSSRSSQPRQQHSPLPLSPSAASCSTKISYHTPPYLNSNPTSSPTANQSDRENTRRTMEMPNATGSGI